MLKIEENVSLSKYSTLGVGGCASYLVVCKSSSEIKDALNWAVYNDKKFVIIGSGSNVLFSDNGFKGLVIINKAVGVTLDGNRLTVDSGTTFNQIARKTLGKGLVGLHYGIGIPGTIGGAIVGNAGALGWDISKTLISAEVWQSGETKVMKNKDFNFEYRNTILRGKINTVILNATFILERGDVDDITTKVQDDIKRRGKSYVGKTCGSYFKNPEQNSAGELIESLGLKGFNIGDAEVSPFHANVIRNLGNAKSKDILKLEGIIQKKVYDKYHILLEPEVIKIGF